MELAELKPGKILSNNNITDLFRCSPQGGMRRSHKTNTLILVSNHTKALYEDRWEGDTFHYTGMGQVGNQIMTNQNKTLAESNITEIENYLFEVFIPKKYVYIGKVVLAQEPYQEEQLDDNGNIRFVWVFPLKLVENQKRILLPDKLIKNKQEQRVKRVKKMSNDAIAIRAKSANEKIVKRKTTSYTYEFDPFVSEFAKRWAKGICQLCDNPAPFLDTRGEPYLIAHHIEWLSREGMDSIYNTIALCPNCNERMNVLDSESDIKKLKEKIEEVQHSIGF